jgi:hypothetical protein
MMSNQGDCREHLREGCLELVEATKDWVKIASKCEWDSRDQRAAFSNMRTFLFRAVAIKQFESLSVILDLDERRHGFAAVQMLRVMCEELGWVRYLGSLQPEEAGQVLHELGAVGIRESFLAQDNYYIKNDDFSEAWQRASERSANLATSHLRTFFDSQGFSLKPGQHAPSFYQIAKRTDLEREYKFLYHATSRVVHFSVPELFRRVWGDNREVSISSSNFERYWAAFSLYWGAQLFALTFIDVVLILGEPDVDDSIAQRMLQSSKKLKKHGAVPLLTVEELLWRDDYEDGERTSSVKT